MQGASRGRAMRIAWAAETRVEKLRKPLRSRKCALIQKGRYGKGEIEELNRVYGSNPNHKIRKIARLGVRGVRRKTNVEIRANSGREKKDSYRIGPDRTGDRRRAGGSGGREGAGAKQTRVRTFSSRERGHDGQLLHARESSGLG